jgi:hypothetical protein
MNRQFNHRVEREWNKIRLGSPCTKFVERNNLFTLPHILRFKAMKIEDDLMCVCCVNVFDFREGLGFLERAVICQFVDSLFSSLGSVELGFFSEEDFDEGEEIDDLGER